MSSSTLAANIIRQCGVNLDPVSDLDIQDDRIVSVTLSCFQRMLENALAQPETMVTQHNTQMGGRGDNLTGLTDLTDLTDHSDFPLVSYLQSRGVKKITKETKAPLGLQVGGQAGRRYWAETNIIDTLNSERVKEVNRRL